MTKTHNTIWLNLDYRYFKKELLKIQACLRVFWWEDRDDRDYDLKKPPERTQQNCLTIIEALNHLIPSRTQK
jgi:hypothetical protein